MTKKQPTKSEQRSVRAISAITIIVMLLIGVLIASICTQGFRNPDPFGLFGKQQEEQPLPGGDGGLVVDPDDPDANMLKLSLTPSAVASSADDNKTKTLTATVSPANAPQEVDWTIAFVNPSSEWATGKTVTDYVTVTPASDGAKTATVKCLQAFGEQIKVTCKSRSDASKQASCTVDYVKGITFNKLSTKYGANGKLKIQDIPLTYTIGVGTMSDPTARIDFSWDMSDFLSKLLQGVDTHTTSNYKWDGGTISKFPSPIIITKDFNMLYSGTKSVPDNCIFLGFSKSISSAMPTPGDTFIAEIGEFLNLINSDIVIAGHESQLIDNYNDYFARTTDPILAFELNITVSGTYLHVTHTIQFYFFPNVLVRPTVSDVTVNPGDVVFY